MIWVAGVALVIDLATAFITHRGAQDSINMTAAFLHNVPAAFASFAVFLAGARLLPY